MNMRMPFSDTICDSIRDNWDGVCICDANSTHLTYGEFGNKMLAFHQFLSLCKVNQNDKINLIAPNSIDWCVIYLAAITYGAVIIPISSELPPQSICNLIKHSDAKVTFVSDDVRLKVGIDILRQLTTFYSLSDEIIYSCSRPIPKDAFHLPNVSNEHFSIISYTSGTSGHPKGVMLSLVSIVENLVFARKSFPLQKSDRIVSSMPFSHSFGSLYELLYPFSIGATIYLLQKKPTPQIVLKVFNTVHPKMFFSVPLVIEKIFQEAIATVKDIPSLDLHNDVSKENYRMQFMRYFSPECETIVIGGAKLNPHIEDVLTTLRIPFSCGYGMTECGPVVSWNNPANAKAHSVGQLVEGMHGKTINVQNGVGEIVLKGTNIMLGYYKNTQATAETIDEDGWLHTGDMGYIDNDGYIFLKGRKKNVILRNNGINIYVDDIESIVKSTCPEVEDCVVFERENIIIAKVVLLSECSSLSKTLTEINRFLPRYASIAKIEVEANPIRRNSKNEILREFYR